MGRPADPGTKWKRWSWLRERAPVGGKSITVGLTGAMLPGTLKKKDPMQLERSRTERAAAMGAGTVGGFAGMGLASKYFPGKVPGPVGPAKGAGWMSRARFGRGPLRRLSLPLSFAGAIGGAIGAERLIGKPFKMGRKRRLEKRLARESQQAPQPRMTRAQMLGMATRGEKPQLG